jgi:ACT domain-containing protein
MKAVITVIGKDKTGIIYKVSKILYEANINIEDISQTVMQDYFTMIMLVSGSEKLHIEQIREKFSDLAGEGLSIQIQKTEIFDVMHKI